MAGKAGQLTVVRRHAADREREMEAIVRLLSMPVSPARLATEANREPTQAAAERRVRELKDSVAFGQPELERRALGDF